MQRKLIKSGCSTNEEVECSTFIANIKHSPLTLKGAKWKRAIARKGFYEISLK